MMYAKDALGKALRTSGGVVVTLEAKGREVFGKEHATLVHLIF